METLDVIKKYPRIYLTSLDNNKEFEVVIYLKEFCSTQFAYEPYINIKSLFKNLDDYESKFVNFNMSYNQFIMLLNEIEINFWAKHIENPIYNHLELKFVAKEHRVEKNKRYVKIKMLNYKISI